MTSWEGEINMEMYDIQNDYGYAYDGEGAYDYESDDYESDYDH